MNFPSFNQIPLQIQETSNRKIYIFEESEKNIDHKTVESFGKEWKAFHGFTGEEIKSLGNSYFDLVSDGMLNKNHDALEVGCGSGRFIKYVAERSGSVTGVDPSEAIFAADELIGADDKVRLVKASASGLPFEDESFDFVYSIGVLHHIPDTAMALKDCVGKLKKGGYFLVYIYYNLDNRGPVFKTIFNLMNGARRMISTFSPGLKRFSCNILALVFYMPFVLLCRVLKFAGVKEERRKKIPLQFYEDKSFYIIRNDALDRFGTPLEQRFSKQEIKKMMDEAGLEEIIFSGKMPYWHAVGRKASDT